MDGLLIRQKDEQEEAHWLSVSDLMAGLMMVFLFVAVALMQSAQNRSNEITKIAEVYSDTQQALYAALFEEFDKDLQLWNAKINKKTLTFTFESPEVLFDEGKAALKPEYKYLLRDFFPRYMKVIAQFRQSITEVRIEGHTSSQWNSFVTVDEAYFRNMKLSQGRTRAVLAYLFEIPATQQYQSWIKANVAAVGYSSSKLVTINCKDDDMGLSQSRENCVEDEGKSKRVSFRVITNAEEQIMKILAKRS